jgi:hypothetical protein
VTGRLSSAIASLSSTAVTASRVRRVLEHGRREHQRRDRGDRKIDLISSSDELSAPGPAASAVRTVPHTAMTASTNTPVAAVRGSNR